MIYMSNLLIERPTDEIAVEKLTDKQLAFVEAYVGEARFNATEAAKIAGYSFPNVTSWDVMQSEAVKTAIKVRTAATAMHADELLMRLGHEARGIGEYLVYDEDTKHLSVDVKRLKKDGKGSLITGIKSNRWGQTVEFIDPLAAQAILVKVHNLVPETNLEQALGDAVRVRAMAELAKMISGGRQGNSVGGTLSVSGVTDAAGEAGNTTDVVIGGQHGTAEGYTSASIVDGTGLGTGDMVSESVQVVSATQSATSDATLTGEARADTAATLGICQVCGELAADKVTRGGARVCSVCIP